jgi:hypothetical protein
VTASAVRGVGLVAVPCVETLPPSLAATLPDDGVCNVGVLLYQDVRDLNRVIPFGDGRVIVNTVGSRLALAE